MQALPTRTSYAWWLKVCVRSLGESALKRTTVTKGAISQARGIVGEAPLRELYEQQVHPHGPADMPGVMFHGHRIMAIDGSTLNMPDEKANSDFYGHLSGGYGDCGRRSEHA